jgi:hypothetical protein
LCLQLAKLLVLHRMLKFVTRIKNRSLEAIRRLSRVFFTLVVLGGMVGCMLAAALMSQVTLSVFAHHTPCFTRRTKHATLNMRHVTRHVSHSQTT